MDLKSFREDKLKIKTQSEFSELLGVEQSQISRWEKDASNMPWQAIQKIAEKTGATLDEITGWTKPISKPLDVTNSWKKVDFTKNSISDYIASALDSLAIATEEKEKYIVDLQTGVLNNVSKPQVTIVGRSDTGKSTLINALLGAEKMPTSWTPTTSIAVYIKHISDKPNFIEEDVWVFSNQVGNETLWNERQLYDEAYCRKWKIGAGGAEILKSFGTRQGENYSKQAGSAVMFIDAPILSTCDIVDLPGFGTETESDDDITFKATQRADIIIYLSQANGFMRIEDITYLKRNITELPVWEQKDKNKLKPLANLFVLASQSHAVNNGNRVQLKEILNVGCKNLLKTLPDEYWTSRKGASGYDYEGYGKHELRDRFYTYTTDIPDLSARFNDSLKEILEMLPEIINERVKGYVREYVKVRKPNLENELQKYENIVAEKDKYVDLLAEINANELARVQGNDKRKNDVLSSIKDLEAESINEFSTYVSETINTDNLILLMKNRGIRNKKDDVEQFGSYLQSLVQERCESILLAKSEKLSKKTDDYIQSYADDIGTSFAKQSIEADFDAGWAFASALAKAGMIGGLATFVATSAYVATNLISLGFGAAGAAGAIFSNLFYLPIMGPIGLAVALALTVTLGLIKLFGGGWEKKVAQKIVSAFEENKVNEKFRNGIREYWEQTENAFNIAAEGLEEEWSKYINQLEDTISGYDVNEINNKIGSLKNVSDFFDHIPL